MGSEFLTPDKSEELSFIVRIQKWVQDFLSLYLLGEKETVLIKTSAFNQITYCIYSCISRPRL